MRRADARERLEQLRHPLARVDVPERADQRVARDRGRLDTPGRATRDAARCADRPVVAGRARAVVDVARVDDRGPSRASSTSPASGKSSGRFSQRGGMRLSSTPCAEQPADDAVLALHRVEVAVAVAPADRERRRRGDGGRSRAGRRRRASPQRVDDPAVGVGVVADVVDGEIGAARRALRPALDDDDVDPLARAPAGGARSSRRSRSARAASARSSATFTRAASRSRGPR